MSSCVSSVSDHGIDFSCSVDLLAIDTKGASASIVHLGSLTPFVFLPKFSLD